MAILSGISEDAKAWGRVTLCHPNSLFLQWKHFLGLWEKGSLRSMDFSFTRDLRSLIDPFMFCWQSNDILSADPTSIKNCLKFFGWIQSHVRFVRKLQQRWGFLWSCSSYWVKSSTFSFTRVYWRAIACSIFRLTIDIGKLSSRDWKPLIDKISARIHSQSARRLSFAGRLQLIQSVLYSIQAFGVMCLSCQWKWSSRLRRASIAICGRVLILRLKELKWHGTGYVLQTLKQV